MQIQLSLILAAALVLSWDLLAFSSASKLSQHELPDAQAFSHDGFNRRQSSSVLITGVHTLGVQPRLEIRELAQNADQWNLYLLGLLRFQKTSQSDPTSYYQVSGIHGRPYIPWQGVQPAAGQDSPGYCNHVINTFLNWHRPYLALFEQTLFQHMVDVVNEFPVGSIRSRYASALLTFRMPYWDWAAVPPAGQSVFPDFLQMPTINVTKPSGAAIVANPLYSYKFHPVSTSDFVYDPYAYWNETKRAPTSQQQNATSNDARVAAVFNNNRQSLQQRLYNLFVLYKNFTEFGNEAWESSSGIQNADSLESVHDAVHALVGLNGHMTYLDYSAFDPSFYLHHTNVDRLFALWQAIYPNSYVEPMQAVVQTYTIAIGSTRDVNSSLEPFLDSDSAFWTAASSRNVSTFGYTYPELYPTTNVSTVMAAINQLYGPNAGTQGFAKRARDVQGFEWQYTVNIRSRKSLTIGTYAVYVFLGDCGSDPTSWPMDPNLAGVQVVLSGLTRVDAASNGRIEATSGVLVSGTVPLTAMLHKKMASGHLFSLAKQDVESYLQKNIQWRVATFDGTEMPIENVPGLQIDVVGFKICPAASDDGFPHIEGYTRLPVITPGNVGSCW